MKKYIVTSVLACLAPNAFAGLGSGLYFSVGGGGGWLSYDQLDSFDLGYPDIAFDTSDPIIRKDRATANFYDTAQYSEQEETVIAGRAAIGYLWDIFEGEPTKIGNSIYTINATFGLEVGYRIFDTIDNNHTEVETDSNYSVPFDVYETFSSEVKNQAVDLSAVARLPFTQDNKFALLLKGGVAYNNYKIENMTLVIDAQIDPAPPNYDMTIDLGSETYDEFLPVASAGLEYMLYSHFGVSAEYSAIFGSSHDADSQLLSGNLIFRF